MTENLIENYERARLSNIVVLCVQAMRKTLMAVLGFTYEDVTQTASLYENESNVGFPSFMQVHTSQI